MALTSAGTCSPKRRRRLDRLLSIVCRFLLLASMLLWSISCSLLKTEEVCFILMDTECACLSQDRSLVKFQLFNCFCFPTSSSLVPPWHGCRRADTGQSAGPEWRCGVLGFPAQPVSVPHAPSWPGSLLRSSD